MDERVAACVDGLNSLYFGPRSQSSPSVGGLGGGLPECKQEALKSIASRVRLAGRPPDGLTRPGALSALRACSGGYDDGALAVGTRVGLELSRLSLPSGGKQPVDFASVLGGHPREVLADFQQHMLIGAPVWRGISDKMAEVPPFTDPSLHKRGAYLAFLKKLFDANLLTFVPRARGRIGAFSVTKKNEKQRLVLDCRQVNFLFRPPPYTELGGCIALSEM